MSMLKATNLYQLAFSSVECDKCRYVNKVPHELEVHDVISCSDCFNEIIIIDAEDDFI